MRDSEYKRKWTVLGCSWILRIEIDKQKGGIQSIINYLVNRFIYEW